MIREIVTDPFFLSQKSEPATKQDQQVIQDLLDTIHPCRPLCRHGSQHDWRAKDNFSGTDWGNLSDSHQSCHC